MFPNSDIDYPDKHQHTIDIVYSNDIRLNHGPVKALKNIYNDIINYRWLIWLSFVRDFRSIYIGTGLGIVWAVILPVMPIGVYWLLTQIRVLPVHEGIDPLLYIVIGITLWYMFSGAILKPISIIESRISEISKVGIPLICTIISGFAQIIFDSLVRLSLLIPIYLFIVGIPPITSIFVLLIIIPALFGCLAMGLLLGLCNTVYRDVGKVISIFMQYLIFLSGAIFPLPKTPLIDKLIIFNPFYVVIDQSRELMVFGYITQPLPVIVILTFACFFFVIVCIIFYRLEYRIRGIIS